VLRPTAQSAFYKSTLGENRAGFSRDRDFQKILNGRTRTSMLRRVFFLWPVQAYRRYKTNRNKKQKGKKGIMNLDTLKELYVNELRDLYNAEGQLIKALPKMAKAAASDELKEAFEKHLEQTKGHVQRLEEVFAEIDEKPKGKTCQAMKGLIEEGSEVLKADGEDSVIDAGIIVAAQKVEHYEIVGYGSVRSFAQLLGKDRSAELLQQTLDEESQANELLNQLAEGIVNPEAIMESELVGAGSSR
jgi:ferritin-like metal-binding protein YciE